MSAAGIAALRRKLHRWELEHLRTVCAEQADRIGALEAELAELRRELHYVEDLAESWRNDALCAIEAGGQAVGLTKDGRVIALQTELNA